MGGPLTLSYNGAFTISQAYKGAARVVQVTNSASDQYNPATLLTISSFAPIGGPTQIVFGNTLEETRSYNNRQQVMQMRVYDPPSTDVLNLQFTWATAQVPNNGNLMAFSGSGTGTPTFSRSYAYDALSRLGTMSSPADPGGCTGLSWTYDAWANRTAQNVTGGSCGAPQTAVYLDSRLSDASYDYDAAGNLTDDPTHTYAYDAENRIKQVDGTVGNCSTATACYTYDANGNRIQKTTGSNQVHYFYDEGGEVLVEKNQSGTVLKEYVYGAGQRMERSGGKTYFVHTDHLGSARTVSDYTGCVVEKLDYLPFGESSASAGSCATATTTHKFTGKERDSESGLDNFGARYNSSWMGRFMTPDDFLKDSHVGDPQSWNKYAYVRNNPLRYVDPTGEKATVSTQCKTDEDDKQTCNVTISASIEIYATSGSGLTQSQLNAAAGTIKSSIESAWSGTYQQGGVTYNVSTNVTVGVAAGESAAMSSGAQNVIGLSNGDAAPGADSFVNPRSFLSAVTGRGPDTGVWNINNLGSGIPAHEFTHLLGTANKPGAVLSNTAILDPSLNIPHSATPSDYGWALQEANGLRHIAPGVAMAPGRATVTPRAAWHWWK